MDGASKIIRIGALVSGGGSNLQAVIDGCESGTVDGKMAFVGSDNPEAPGLQRAAAHRIPSFVVDYRSIIRRYRADPSSVRLPAGVDPMRIARQSRLFAPDTDLETLRTFMMTRLAAEAMLLEQIQSNGCDLVVLAGFMRNLTPYFIDGINTDPDQPRIMNIHPSLLPAFPGVDGYGDTFRYGCKVGGCTVHFVDYGEDTGPIIGQTAFDIENGDTLETVRSRGLTLEWQLYPRCIQLFAQNRLTCVRETYRNKKGQVTQRTVVKVLPENS